VYNKYVSKYVSKQGKCSWRNISNKFVICSAVTCTWTLLSLSECR